MVFDDSREQIYFDAIAKYGEHKQVIQCIQELSELTQALTKELIRQHPDVLLHPKPNVKEEMADVLVMIEQVMFIFGIEIDEVEEVMQEKVQRLKSRIDGGS